MGPQRAAPPALTRSADARLAEQFGGEHLLRRFKEALADAIEVDGVHELRIEALANRVRKVPRLSSPRSMW